MLSTTAPMALVALLTCVLIGPALAETKCEVKTSTCVDTRTGEPRTCSTTICKDEKGDIVSINTIVLKGAAPTGGATGPKGKVQLKDLNVTKEVDKDSPR